MNTQPTETATDKRLCIYTHVLFLVLSCIILIIYSQAASPLYGTGGGDANVFKILGIGICQGKLPYAELFDHKGPLLFYLYALACSVGNAKLGLLIIETIFLYVTILCQYKIARMYVSRGKVFVVLAVALIFIVITIGDGGQTEFFQLTFGYVALYYLLKFYNTREFAMIPRLSLIMGAMFALSALMRLNDGCLSIGVPYFFLVIWLLLHRRVGLALKSVALFILASAVVFLPFAVYFLSKGIFGEMWYGMITFNFQYTALAQNQNPMLKVIILSLFNLCAFLTVKRRADNTIPLYIILPVTLFAIVGIGNRATGHYYMALTPILGLITIWLYSKEYLSLMLWILVVGGWNIGKSKPMWGSLLYYTYQDIKEMQNRGNRQAMTDEAIKLLQKVPEDQRSDKVWIYNIFNTMNLDMFTSQNYTPGNVYFIAVHRQYDPAIKGKENFYNSDPEWILVMSDYIASEDSIPLALRYDSIGAVENEDYQLKLLKRKSFDKN